MKIARFEFSLFGINTYAVFDPDSKECAIIDPGMSTDQERKAVERFITDNGLKLTHIINTHLHIDHAIGNFWLKSHFPAPRGGSRFRPSAWVKNDRTGSNVRHTIRLGGC